MVSFTVALYSHVYICAEPSTNLDLSEMHRAVPKGAEIFSARCGSGFNSWSSRKEWPMLQSSEASNADSSIHLGSFLPKLTGLKHYVLEAFNP